jgi:hypothetical protein
MRVTIVVDDDLVLVDGKPAKVDLSPLVADNIHAVQWYGDKGEVEFRSDPMGDRGPNDRIKDIEYFQRYIDAWRVQREADEQRERRQLEELEEMKRKFEQTRQG